MGVQTDFIVYLMFKLNNIQKQFREIEGKNKKLLLIKGRLSKFVDNSGSALSNIYINSGPCGGIVRFAHKFFGSLYAFGKDTQTSQCYLKDIEAFIDFHCLGLNLKKNIFI